MSRKRDSEALQAATQCMAMIGLSTQTPLADAISHLVNATGTNEEWDAFYKQVNGAIVELEGHLTELKSMV